MKLRLFLLILLFPCGLRAGELLPSPVGDTPLDGKFVLNARTVIRPEASELTPLMMYLYGYLPETNFLRYNYFDPSDVIALAIDPALGEEAYRLEVQPTRIEIAGGGYGGVFNGIQTLLQLLPVEVYDRELRLPVEIACRKIEDAPRFSYRGQHLDVARTWMDVPKVKRYINLLSHHKINKLHFHLTDDEGWRIEIKSHPELATVGGFRGGDSPVRAVYGSWTKKYGGYYTQAELREIIDYAAVRNIEIIPEIDLPGHSRTIARLHPEILCRYTPDLAASNGYDERSAWCVAREENYALLEDILGELCELFPSPYIHIGGDEVEMSQWKQCPDCQALMRREHMSSTKQLQRLFMTRMIDILARHGKRPAVWDEAIEGGKLTHESRVHGWQSTKACLAATTQGYRTVVMPGDYFYFDMRQSPYEDGHNWAAIFDVSKVYSYSFAPYTPAQLARVEGLEGAFWNELGLSHDPSSTDYYDYMLFPRVCALAELAWNASPQPWEEFNRGLTGAHYARMTAMGINFRPSPPTMEYRDWAWLPVEPAAYYHTIKPEVRITSSMPTGKKTPFSLAEQYRGAARTTRTCRAGDWILFTFAKPVQAREIYLRTGYVQVPLLLFTEGYVEVSRDGIRFERAGELMNGCFSFTGASGSAGSAADSGSSSSAIRAMRVVSTCDGNGSASVMVQPPRIRP